MKSAVGLTLAALSLLSSTAFAAPGTMDVSKQASQVSTQDNQVVLPENKPLVRNEVLQDKRVEKKPFAKKEAIVGERRSPIAVEEKRDKKFFSTPEQKKYDTIERKESAWNGKQSRFSTSEDAYRSKVATRFQDKIGEASPVRSEIKTASSQRTTFDKVNRFAFRKNGNQQVGVTAAGSGQSTPAPIPGETTVLPGGATLGKPSISVNNGSSSSTSR